MKNVKVLIGNYGSGKSELALNFAIRAAARGDRTELLDLDMVNTYFRLTERGKLVEQKEIRLFHFLRTHISNRAKLPFHAFRITDIHLTAIYTNKSFFLLIHSGKNPPFKI